MAIYVPFNEGQQADAYRDRKDIEKVRQAKEDLDYEKKIKERLLKAKERLLKVADNDSKGFDKAAGKFLDEKENRKNRYNKSVDNAIEAGRKAKEDFEHFKSLNHNPSISKSEKLDAFKKANASAKELGERNAQGHKDLKNYKNMDANVGSAVLASMRKDRRTAKHESSIFESVRFI